MLIPEFIDFFVADGPAGGFDEPGIDGDAFIDGQSLASNWRRISELI